MRKSTVTTTSVKKQKIPVWLYSWVGFLSFAALALGGCIIATNWDVSRNCGHRCFHVQEYVKPPQTQAILVLGAGVYSGSRPSPILKNRLDTAIEVWHKHPELPLIMSGDGRESSGNEPRVMARYATKKGVPKERIFIDNHGYSTYESMARAVNTFELTGLTVITQEYHLPRAVYLARNVGLEATGVIAPTRPTGQTVRELREILAKTKAWFVAQMQQVVPASGPIDVSGDGEKTVPDGTYPSDS